MRHRKVCENKPENLVGRLNAEMDFIFHFLSSGDEREGSRGESS